MKNSGKNFGRMLERMVHEDVSIISKLKSVIGRVPIEVLLSVKFKDGHIHHSFPPSAEELALDALENLDIEVGPPSTSQDDRSRLPNRVLFHNRQALGDMLMFTCAVRDFKKAFPDIKVKVKSTAMHVWDNNPNIDWSQWALEDVIDHGNAKGSNVVTRNREAVQQAIKENKAPIIYIGPSKGTNASNRSDLHFANAYRLSIQDSLGIRFPQGPIRPDIWLTQEELQAPPLIAGKYWLITAGEKGDWGLKTYPFDRWQKVVEMLPNIRFVQIGLVDPKNPKRHKHPTLKGSNVISYLGETQGRDDGIRKLFNLFLNAEGSLGLVSFQMHLSAAFNKPCVVIAGAREPVWFTRYPGQRYLSTDGCLPCTINNEGMPTACWYCSTERCTQMREGVPGCVDLIQPEDIVNAIMSYYEGGRLEGSTLLEGYKREERKDTPVKVGEVGIVETKVRDIGELKTSDIEEPVEVVAEKIEKIERRPRDFSNVVKTTQTVMHVVPPRPVVDNTLPAKYGMEWGGGSITDRDWTFMEKILKDNKVKTILEFGVGLSSLLMASVVDKVVSYETTPGWIKKIQKIAPKNLTVRTWDGKSIEHSISKFDMAFVDGPAGGENREWSTKIASEHANIVMVHDAGRKPEREWQAKYLEKDFRLIEKGGHRCHYWSREVEPAVLEVLETGKNLVRFYCNSAAYGGGEKSPVWLQNKLVEKGYDVELVPINGKICPAIKNDLSKDVKTVSDIRRLKDPCDIFVMYCNDHVYGGFVDNTEIYEQINARRKVMILNYQLGNAGRLRWTFGWDKYLFLNTIKEEGLKKRVPGAITKALPPPVDLSLFFKNEPDYGSNLKLIRHSSQGDNKYPRYMEDLIDRLIAVKVRVEFYFMPAPSFIRDRVVIHKHARNEPPVNEFLKLGNCFWYHLPEGYEDQGPRVIMEAQASGLPVICDNRSGAKERVNNETGWLCEDSAEYVEVVRSLTPEVLESKGKAARVWAKEQYNPDRWIDEIVGND